MIKVKDLEMLNDIDVLYNSKIILYGAGDYGHRAVKLLDELEIPVCGFCDSDSGKWKTEYNGYRIFSIEELSAILSEEYIIIITIVRTDCIEQVLKTLESYGILQTDCYTYFGLKYGVELHIEDWRIKETYRKKLKIEKKIYNEIVSRRNELAALYAINNALLHDDMVLVFQPGKVGSTTVFESLLKEQIKCAHFHYIFGKYARWGRNYKSSEEILEGVKLLRKVEKIKIISLIREPIGRDLSMYFQFFDEYICSDWIKPNIYKNVIEVLDLFTKFGEYGFLFEWFVLEMEEAFGIDVYQYDFDKNRGYQIIEKDNIQLLLIKVEKLDDCEEAIGQFIGVNNFKLVKANIGENKPYKFVYNELKRTIKIPEYIINFYYKDNKCMDHFYTKAEKEGFIKRWKKV